MNGKKESQGSNPLNSPNLHPYVVDILGLVVFRDNPHPRGPLSRLNPVVSVDEGAEHDLTLTVRVDPRQEGDAVRGTEV